MSECDIRVRMSQVTNWPFRTRRLSELSLEGMAGGGTIAVCAHRRSRSVDDSNGGRNSGVGTLTNFR